jgi:hypothetical protein
MYKLKNYVIIGYITRDILVCNSTPPVHEGSVGKQTGNTREIYVRFEVSKAVTMKNDVFWDIETQFVLHRRHITSPLQSSAG